MRHPPRRHRVRTRHPRYSIPNYMRGKGPILNIGTVRASFTRRGFQPNPLLEDRRGADITFAKPLPSGGRVHVRITDGKRKIKIERHVDRADPMRDPLKHITDDILNKEHAEHTTQTLAKKEGLVRRSNVKAYAETMADLSAEDMLVNTKKIMLPTLGKVVTIKYKPSHPSEATSDVYRGEIIIGDKYLKLPREARIGTAIHEEGHFLENSWLNPDNYWEVTDSGIFGEAKQTREGRAFWDGLGGTFRTDESVAESYLWYVEEPDRLMKEYPRAYKFWEKIDSGEDFMKAVRSS